MAELFLGENMFDDAQVHVERVKSHATNSPYNLGHAMYLQARIWFREGKLEEANSEVLRAADVFEKLGATEDLEYCRGALRMIERGMKT